MRNLILCIFINLISINYCISQNDTNGDFLELGLRKAKFLGSEFLQNSEYKNQLSDPYTVPSGFMASATGINYAIKMRYGKSNSNKTHLIAEVSYTKRNEQIICFCNNCDKVSIPFTLVKVNSFDVGVGTRYEVLKVSKFKFLVEGMCNYSIASNESNTGYFGYSVHPIIEYNLTWRLNANVKYGFEQSFGDYDKREWYFEFAINFYINKKAS